MRPEGETMLLDGDNAGMMAEAALAAGPAIPAAPSLLLGGLLLLICP
jgi:hypothetical protein